MGKKHQVLARKYRPQRFADVIGQESVLTTLKNAIRYDRAAHAYLFCGSRGVGKTTLARLFAKALNCPNRGGDLEPCNQCPSCLEITSGQSLDVMEIDGASNRGIDDIRQINETVAYAPSHGKYKIYIIDEVHMLTKEAFNALLKTLEEPPEQAKFFFATTEPHKVLPTIISRCQRFDLLRIGAEQIAEKLAQIAADMNRPVELDALHLIASFADGSLRDAESLFDQILCFSSASIEAETVRQALGLVSQELFFDLDRAFSECNLSYAFELVDRLFQAGKDLPHFLEQLVEHFRCLSLHKTMGDKALPASIRDRYAASARLYTQAQCLYILDLLIGAEQTLQKSPFPRVSLESTLLHLIRSKNRIPIEVIARRLSELENSLKLQQDGSAASKGPGWTGLGQVSSPAQTRCEQPKAEGPGFALSDELTSPQPELKPAPFNPFSPLEKSQASLANAPSPDLNTAELPKQNAPMKEAISPMSKAPPSVFASTEISTPTGPLQTPSDEAPSPSPRIPTAELPKQNGPMKEAISPTSKAPPSVFASTEISTPTGPLQTPSDEAPSPSPRIPTAELPKQNGPMKEAISPTSKAPPSVFASTEISTPISPLQPPHDETPSPSPRIPSVFDPPSPSLTAAAAPSVFASSSNIEPSSAPQRHASHYETLMRFAAVELEGTVKKLY